MGIGSEKAIGESRARHIDCLIDGLIEWVGVRVRDCTVWLARRGNMACIVFAADSFSCCLVEWKGQPRPCKKCTYVSHFCGLRLHNVKCAPIIKLSRQWNCFCTQYLNLAGLMNGGYLASIYERYVFLFESCVWSMLFASFSFIEAMLESGGSRRPVAMYSSFICFS